MYQKIIDQKKTKKHLCRWTTLVKVPNFVIKMQIRLIMYTETVLTFFFPLIIKIVRLGNSVTTTKEVKYPTQRKYPSSGTSIGSSSIVTERSTVSADCKVKTHTQREYPHGRKLGYSNVSSCSYGLVLLSLTYFWSIGQHWRWRSALAR